MKQIVAVGDTGQQLINKISSNFDELYNAVEQGSTPEELSETDISDILSKIN